MNNEAQQIELLRAALNNALNQRDEAIREVSRLGRELGAEQARLADALEVVRDVTPALIAAISLLERGGKRAAASDKMFAQMLKDYSASVARARAFLALAAIRTMEEKP